MSETKVVHCKVEPYDIYIGRGKDPKSGKASIWGNPFTHKEKTTAEHKVETREEAVEKFLEWFLKRKHLVTRLYELKGKTIACWCHPQACHGHVLAKLADALPEEFAKTGIPYEKVLGLLKKAIPDLPTLGTLECSTKGHPKFSAFNAHVTVGGITDVIERHYQFAKRFDEKVPKTLKEAKGKVPTHIEIQGQTFPAEDLTPYYTYLWLLYLDQNPDLVDYAKNFDSFNDIFRGSAINCQADVIEAYVKEGRGKLLETCGEFLEKMKLHELHTPKVPVALLRFDPSRTACFTGHRPQHFASFDWKKPWSNPTSLMIAGALRREIKVLIEQGYDTFISGGALGVDQIAFWVVQYLIEQEGMNIRNVLAVPFKGQEKAWKDEKLVEKYHEMVNKATEVIYVDELPSPYGYEVKDGIMKTGNQKLIASQKLDIRNHFMVDQSGKVIAVWSGKTGGTKNCIDYAVLAKREIVWIDASDDFKTKVYK